MSSTAGSLTLMDGTIGSLNDVIQRPFVTSVVPIVGNGGSQTIVDERVSRLREGGGSNSTVSGSGSSASSSSHSMQLPSKSSAERSMQSVSDVRRAQAEQDDAASREAQELLARGNEAKAAGKPNVARIYYQQAAKRATGTLREQIQNALDSLAKPKSR
jgi:hypothetical protein